MAAHASAEAVPVETETRVEVPDVVEVPETEDVECTLCNDTGQVMSSEDEEMVPCPDCSEPEPPTRPEPMRPIVPVEIEVRVGGKTLKTFLTQIGTMVDECKVVARNHEGLIVKAVDPAHVAMVEVALPMSSLTDLSCRSLNGIPFPKDGQEFGIDIDKFMGVAKRAAKNEVSVLYRNDPKESFETAFATETRTMNAVDTAGMSDTRIPNLKLPVTFRIPAKSLLEACKAAGEISDHIRLEAAFDADDRPKLVVTAEGDVDKFRAEFLDNTGQIEAVSRPWVKCASFFPLDYFEKMVKSVKDSTLTVHMGNDYPIKFEWDDATKGTFLLAPRIESEPVEPPAPELEKPIASEIAAEIADEDLAALFQLLETEA
jgi:DNA polymerase III sliding clamp (beta) subunit (PCNA family)